MYSSLGWVNVSIKMATCHQPLILAFKYVYSSLGWVNVSIKMDTCHQPFLQPLIYVYRSLGWVDFLYQDGHVSPATPPGLYICIQVTRLGWFSEWRWPRHTCHQPLLQAFIYVLRSLGWVDFLYEDGHVSPTTPPGLYICTLVTRVGRYIMMGTCQEPLLQAF